MSHTNYLATCKRKLSKKNIKGGQVLISNSGSALYSGCVQGGKSHTAVASQYVDFAIISCGPGR